MVNIVRTLFNLDRKPEPVESVTKTGKTKTVKRVKRINPDPSEFKHRVSATLRTKKEEEE